MHEMCVPRNMGVEHVSVFIIWLLLFFVKKRLIISRHIILIVIIIIINVSVFVLARVITQSFSYSCGDKGGRLSPPPLPPALHVGQRAVVVAPSRPNRCAGCRGGSPRGHGSK